MDESIKDRIVPLITIPPIEFYFEVGIPKKTVHEHEYPLPKSPARRWSCARHGKEQDEGGNAMTKLRDLKKRLMEDPEFREEYALADQEYALVAQLIRARTEASSRKSR